MMLNLGYQCNQPKKYANKHGTIGVSTTSTREGTGGRGDGGFILKGIYRST
jgi:hypothetical protein